MKKITIVLVISCFFLTLAGCNFIEFKGSENTSVLSLVEKEKTMINGKPAFAGKIKNEGDKAVTEVVIKFKIYKTADKDKRIDTANAFLANGNEILQNEILYFEAISYDTETIDDLEHYKVEFSFSEKN